MLKGALAVCIAALIVLAFAIKYEANAEGTVTLGDSPNRPMRSVAYSWAITTNAFVAADATRPSGQIERVVIPGQSTTNTYDVQLLDTNGVDLFAGAFTGLTNATKEVRSGHSTNFPVAVDGSLTLVVTNYAIGAHVETSGVVRVYWR
jgi:hypothetical protein